MLISNKGRSFAWIATIGFCVLFAIRPDCFAVPTAADAFTALGSAGPKHWQVLEVGNGTVTEQVDLSNPQGGVFGNVGVQKNGKLQDSGPIIHGDLYLGDNAQAQFSGSATVTGTVHLGTNAKVSPSSLKQVHDNPQPLLDAARANAISASATASAVPKTVLVGNGTGNPNGFYSGINNGTISLGHASATLTAGTFDLKTFQMDHSTLTLTGPGYFIFNITSTFKLSTGKIFLANGATEDHVLFNYTGTQDVAFSGGTGGAGTNPKTNTESVLHGIILALNANVNLAPGLVVGEIISGKNISIVSGAKVKPPPVPDQGATISLGLLSMIGLFLFQRLSSRDKRAGLIKIPRS